MGGGGGGGGDFYDLPDVCECYEQCEHPIPDIPDNGRFLRRDCKNRKHFYCESTSQTVPGGRQFLE